MQPAVLKVHLRGIAPLLLQNPQGVNPTHPLVREIKAITSKPAKRKTDEDYVRVMDLEFLLHIYYDDELGPYVPAEMVEAALRDAAKVRRLGKVVQARVMVLPDKIPILYDGPRSLDELVRRPEFRDVRPVVLQKSRSTLRCRPRFNRWELKFEIHYLTDQINREDIIAVLPNLCLGSFRPRYGRVAIVEVA